MTQTTLLALAEPEPDDYYLASLSSLSLRSFPSSDAAIEAILHVIVEHLGIRTSFLTRITKQQDQNTVLAAYNLPGGCDLPPGIDLTLHQTF